MARQCREAGPSCPRPCHWKQSCAHVCSTCTHTVCCVVSLPAPPQVMSDICKVGAAIETALGSAQDIEGVVDPEGNIYVVQTRPQV